MVSLKPVTTSVLKALKAASGIDAASLAKQLGQDYAVIMGAVNELASQDLGYFKEEESTEIALTDEGLGYAMNHLPESRLFKLLCDMKAKQVELNALRDKAKSALGMDDKLFFLSLGHLKQARWTSQAKVGEAVQVIVLKQEYEDKPEEQLLSLIAGSGGGLDVRDVPADLKAYVEGLKRRTLVIEKKYTKRSLHLTEKGKKLDTSKVSALDEVAHLTTEMITTGSWKEAKLKAYDVSKPGAHLNAGKIHPLIEIINKVREIFFSMGFTEIRGPIVESAFYNFDALYQPQDHPAREMHDTFYLSTPAAARLPPEKYMKAVAEVHEDGGNTGSTGWGYKWNREIATQTIMRTHTTATTVRQLGKAIEEGARLPLKVFSIDRVFRNEKVDFKHLAEFMQVEGIVIGERLSLADLRGTLVEFYTKLGFEQVITRPGFFPYTEPSLEISVFSKELGKWMEIGGSGIFRPEVCTPWGIKEPVRVLAWGQGLERIAMLRLKRNDIRDLYKNPLSWLRRAPYPRSGGR
ncbi:MAG: phenylalanine--tRNA ligase subunit alpha [Candidatus Lokiarchaeota archaeon]|nr:phenylalanine--tRNA ligase subunit alpha [Candidatus Lokiarchaeota archaeon]